MKKIFVTILILTFVFSLVSNSYADEKAVGDAIWDKITTHIDDATGNIDAIEIHIKADVGTGTAYILDYPGFWTVLNGIGLCDNPGQEGGVGIRVFKNYPDTTTVTNQIQGYATTGCEYGDNIFRIYFADSLDNPITFDPCTNPLLGMGYVNRGTLDIPVEDYLGFPGLLLNWWPKAVIPPKPAFTAMTVQDSLDGCASFPYWNVLENDSTYHVTDSCDYNYQWGKFALKVNGDPGSSYYVDLKDGYDTDVNFKLKDLQYFPFYLDITSLPDPVGFYDWWYVKGVNASAGSGTWQEWMWKIVGLGTEPMFYVYYDENGANPPIYKIIDGLQKDYGMTDQYFRVNGDYPQGDYIFYGQIE